MDFNLEPASTQSGIAAPRTVRQLTSHAIV
jgi:hypothetical protein